MPKAVLPCIYLGEFSDLSERAVIVLRDLPEESDPQLLNGDSPNLFLLTAVGNEYFGALIYPANTKRLALFVELVLVFLFSKVLLYFEFLADDTVMVYIIYSFNELICA